MDLNRKKISDGIFLIQQKYQSSQTEDITLIYKLDVQRISIVQFNADFSESNRVILQGAGGGLFKQTQVQSFAKGCEVARLTLKKNFLLKNKFRLTLRQPSKEVQFRWIKDRVQALQKLISTSQQLFQKVPISLVPINAISQHMRHKIDSFIDPEFVPNNLAMFGSWDDSILDSHVHWRRPCQFISNIQLQVFRHCQPNDVQKGILTSSQMLSSFKILGRRKELIEKLITKHYNKEGIYRIKLCQSGEWINITIDDYVPCAPLDLPYFSRNSSGQIWPILLQKALAKSLRGYLQLRGCQINQLLQTMTGCPSLRINLQGQNKIKSLIQAFELGYVIYAWVNQQQKKQKIKLPQSHYAYPVIKYSQKCLIFQIDGQQTYLNWDQIVSWFSHLYITKYFNWHQLRIKGMFIWQNQLRATISRWYYSFDLFQTTNIIFSICQQDNSIRWVSQQRPYLDTGLCIFCKTKDKGLQLYSYSQFSITKNKHIQVNLTPGSYTVVPVSTGCRMQSQRTIGKFGQLSKLTDQYGLKQELLSVLKDIFAKYDLLMYRQLGLKQLNSLFSQIGLPLNQSTFQALITRYNQPFRTTHFRGLSLKGFISLWKDMILRDGDQKVFERLQLLGYNRKMWSSTSRLFTFAIHATQQLKVLIRTTKGTDLDMRANLQLAIKGRKIRTNLQGAFLYIMQSNEIFSYAVSNQCDYAIQFSLDLSKSISAIYSNGTGRITKIVQKGGSSFLLHLQKQILSERKFHKVEQFEANKI